MSGSHFSNNASRTAGGAISNHGTATLVTTTLNGNTATTEGGAITNYGSLRVVESTLSGNTAQTLGGGISTDGGTVTTIQSSTLSGNTGATGAGLSLRSGSLTMTNTLIPDSVDGVSVPASQGNVTSSANLSALGAIPENILTVLPLPGSAAICGGLAVNIPTGFTTDQRGTANTQVYGTNSCVDSGAVQTHYSLAFTTQPSNVQTGAVMSPAPTVTVTEGGSLYVPTALTIPLTLDGLAATNTLTNGSATTSGTSGIATYSTLSISQPSAFNALIAALTLNDGTTPATAIGATSSNFAVTPALPTVTAITPASGFYVGGTAVNITGTNFSSTTAVYFGSASASFTVSNATTIVATAPPGSGTVDITVQNTYGTSTKSASDLFTYNGVSASNSSLTASATTVVFTTSPILTATVKDAYGNGIPSVLVTFNVTGSVGSAQSAMTNAQGVAITSLVSQQPGTSTVVATAGGVTVGAVQVTFTPGPGVSLMLLGVTNLAAPQQSGTYNVIVHDAYQNVATGFTGTVTLKTTDPTAIITPSTYTFTPADNGTHSFSLTFNTAGAYLVQATSAGLLSSQMNTSVQDSILVLNSDSTLARLTSAGTQTSTFGTTGSAALYGAVAIDKAGNIWSVVSSSNTVREYDRTGAPITISGSNAAGVSAPTSLFIDGLGQVWTANTSNSVSVLSNNGAAVSPGTGYQGGGMSSPSGLLVDNAGSVWVTNRGNASVTKIFGAASPVVAPTVSAIATNTQGTQP